MVTNRVARLDVNPADIHVQRAGRHLNIEARFSDGRAIEEPHVEIDASTMRPGDFP